MKMGPLILPPESSITAGASHQQVQANQLVAGLTHTLGVVFVGHVYLFTSTAMSVLGNPRAAPNPSMS